MLTPQSPSSSKVKNKWKYTSTPPTRFEGASGDFSVSWVLHEGPGTYRVSLCVSPKNGKFGDSLRAVS